MNDAPPPIPIEVLPPEPPGGPPPHAAPRGRVPIHPMAATLLLIVDNLWNLADWMVIDWFITIPLSFLTVFFPTLFIQRFVQRDGWGSAFAKAMLLGVIAAVPTSITGTPVGLLLLAWAGIKKSQS